jgi:3-hydroxy-9,10-secoandrosta-1,3,5(10)-triene-9,17-dione monooxygenase
VDLWTAQTRDRTLSFGGRAADDALTQKRLAEALWYLDASVTQLRAAAIELGEMAEAGKAAPMELRARMRWNMNRGCELVGKAVSDLFHATTGRAVFLDHPLQQRFQDVQAAMAHAYLTPDQVARAVGGSLLGTSKPEIIL